MTYPIAVSRSRTATIAEKIVLAVVAGTFAYGLKSLIQFLYPERMAQLPPFFGDIMFYLSAFILAWFLLIMAKRY